MNSKRLALGSSLAVILALGSSCHTIEGTPPDNSLTGTNPQLLRIAAAQSLDAFDPNAAGGWNELNGAIHAALFTRDQRGRAVGDLCAERRLEDDQRTLVVTINARASWQRGGSVSAADVVESFRRAVNDPASAVGRKLGPVTKTVAVDPHTVAFTCDQPWPELEDALAELAILPWATYADRSDIRIDRVGAGSWRLLIADPDMCLLTPYTGGHRPRLTFDRLQIISVVDAPARARSLRRGDADAGPISDGDAASFGRNWNIVHPKTAAATTAWAVHDGVEGFEDAALVFPAAFTRRSDLIHLRTTTFSAP